MKRKFIILCLSIVSSYAQANADVDLVSVTCFCSPIDSSLNTVSMNDKSVIIPLNENQWNENWKGMKISEVASASHSAVRRFNSQIIFIPKSENYEVGTPASEDELHSSVERLLDFIADANEATRSEWSRNSSVSLSKMDKESERKVVNMVIDNSTYEFELDAAKVIEDDLRRSLPTIENSEDSVLVVQLIPQIFYYVNGKKEGYLQYNFNSRKIQRVEVNYVLESHIKERSCFYISNSIEAIPIASQEIKINNPISKLENVLKEITSSKSILIGKGVSRNVYISPGKIYSLDLLRALSLTHAFDVYNANGTLLVKKSQFYQQITNEINTSASNERLRMNRHKKLSALIEGVRFIEIIKPFNPGYFYMERVNSKSMNVEQQAFLKRVLPVDMERNNVELRFDIGIRFFLYSQNKNYFLGGNSTSTVSGDSPIFTCSNNEFNIPISKAFVEDLESKGQFLKDNGVELVLKSGVIK